jgi:hypothetical protein
MRKLISLASFEAVVVTALATVTVATFSALVHAALNLQVVA